MSSEQATAMDAYHTTRARLLGPLRHVNVAGEALRDAVARLHPPTPTWSLYGRTGAELGREGFRVLGRTALEAVPDAHAAVLVSGSRTTEREFEGVAIRRVLDLFAGSGNLLQRVAAALNVPGRGAEADPQVRAATRHNLRLAGISSIDVEAADFHELLADCRMGDLVLLDPPWGNAYSSLGLDLSRTLPPVPTLLDDIGRQVDGPITVVVKTSDALTPQSKQSLYKTGALLGVRATRGMPTGENSEFTILRLGEADATGVDNRRR